MTDADELLRRALGHHQSDRVGEAEGLYRQILALEPHHAGALHLLGIIAHQSGRHAEAAELIGKSLKVKPAVPRAWYNYGEALRGLGRFDEAIAAYRAGFAQDRPGAQDLSNFGLILRLAGRLEEAAGQFRMAVAADAGCIEAHNNLGNVLQELGDLAGSLEVYRRAIAARPEFALSHNNMGIVLERFDRLEEAEAAHRRAIELNPKHAGAYTNLGFVLRRQGRFAEALEETRKAAALDATFADAIWNAGCIELTLGDWEAGLPKYESRVNVSALAPVRRFAQPRWDGSELGGRTILIHDEQGFGDVLMAARFLPLVAARGGRVILLVQRELVGLMGSVRGVERVVGDGEPLSAFDVEAPIMSLMYLLKMRPELVPAEVPYLNVDEARRARWGERLRAAGVADGTTKVGLVWQGKRRPDPARSVDAGLLARLGSVAGVVFVSLQKGEGGSVVDRPAGLPLIDLTGEIADFADTAALMTHLDLVITIDTATAHLAGAMGVATWTLIPFVPDWRWELRGERTFWYPTMRLFRQKTRGDWAGVIENVARALSGLARGEV